MRLYQGFSCKAPFLPDYRNAGVARSGRASESGRTQIKILYKEEDVSNRPGNNTHGDSAARVGVVESKSKRRESERRNARGRGKSEIKTEGTIL